MHPSAVLNVANAEHNRIAIQPPIDQWRCAEGAGEVLKVLLECEHALVRLPVPLDLTSTRIHMSAVHQAEHDSSVCCLSASQSPIVNVFDTTRVPGGMSRICGRNFRFRLGSRNIVSTVALLKSLVNTSAVAKLARSFIPASAAFRFDRATISGLYSRPSAVAPRRAAAMTVQAVARSQVDEVVVGLQLRQVEHGLHELLARGHPSVFAWLANGGVVLSRGLLLSLRGCLPKDERLRCQYERYGEPDDPAEIPHSHAAILEGNRLCGYAGPQLVDLIR